MGLDNEAAGHSVGLVGIQQLGEVRRVLNRGEYSTVGAEDDFVDTDLATVALVLLKAVASGKEAVPGVGA